MKAFNCRCWRAGHHDCDRHWRPEPPTVTFLHPFRGLASEQPWATAYLGVHYLDQEQARRNPENNSPANHLRND